MGKKVEQQHHDVLEDQKPKQLDVTMANQIQLFDAISHLPECHTFPHWATLNAFYASQRKHVHNVPTDSGKGFFNLKFSVTNDRSSVDDSITSVSDAVETVSKATTVVLPTALREQFPVSVETPFALLPCPGCCKDVTVSMSYVGKVENQFLPVSVPGEECEIGEGVKTVSSEGVSGASILAEIERQMKASERE